MRSYEDLVHELLLSIASKYDEINAIGDFEASKYVNLRRENKIIKMAI